MGEILTAERMPQEQEALAGYAHFLGSIALRETVERPHYEVNLVDLIDGAAEGDVNFYGAAETNVSTTVIETLLKKGNVMKVHAGFDDELGLVQFGHRYHDIQRNALRYQSLCPELEERTHAEGLNWQRIEAYKRAGVLADHVYVVFSMVPDNVDLTTSKKAGFFTDTMTTAVQATTENEDGIVTESAFVAGITADKNAERHDVQTVRKLYKKWGAEGADTMGTTDFLSRGVLIPKSMIPNGVTNVVEWIDNELGQDFFFGERRPRQDYAQFSQYCMEREARYRDITTKVMDDMIAHRHTFRDPAHAQQVMYDLVKQHTVDHALHDDDIDASVFGEKAKEYIQDGRQARQTGDWIRFTRMQQDAQSTAETTACGGGSGSQNNDNSSDNATNTVAGSGNKKEESKIPNTITCIIKKCRAKSPKEKVVKADCWECPKCLYKVDICDGTVLRKSIYDSGEAPKQEAPPTPTQLDDESDELPAALPKQDLALAA